MFTEEEIKIRAKEIATNVKLICGSGEILKEVVKLLKDEVN